MSGVNRARRAPPQADRALWEAVRRLRGIRPCPWCLVAVPTSLDHVHNHPNRQPLYRCVSFPRCFAAHVWDNDLSHSVDFTWRWVPPFGHRPIR